MKTYVSSEVKSNILGIDLDGFSSGTFITITPEKPTYTHRRAMDGSTETTLNRFQSYLIKFSVQQTSQANDWLNILHGLFKTYQIPFKMPILIRDGMGRSMFFATDCWFEKEPVMSYADVVGSVDWEIRCNNGTMKHGGSGDISTGLEIISAISAALTLAGNLGVNLGVFESVLGETISVFGD
jgi:hypothetical protein